MRKFCGLLLCLAAGCGVTVAAAEGQTMSCNLQSYKALDGLKAQASAGSMTFTWQGESGQQLRATFVIRNGQPMVRELAAQKSGGPWVFLGRDLVPEFQVTTGRRRISRTQVQMFKSLHTEITPELIEKEKWQTFKDAPLETGTTEGDSTPLPRSPDEIHHASASYASNACRVSTDGLQLAITFNGLSLGTFSGDLQFTVYKGSNLLRQEAVAKTEEPSVAYIYKAGLKGFPVGGDTKVVWRDTARAWQESHLGGAVNMDPVVLRARNRMVIVNAGSGSLAAFPPPHKFFFARENEINVGYDYYRKDSDTSFAVGVMQPDHQDANHPPGPGEVDVQTFALYNAPPGTMQRMAVYYYLSPAGDQATLDAALAYTHGDTHKPVPGFKVLISHLHESYIGMLLDRNTLDYRPPWVDVYRNLGINMVILMDYHAEREDARGPGAPPLHPDDPGPLRFKELKTYYEGAARLADQDFLAIPMEEPNTFLGGHWALLTPHPVYFSHAQHAPDMPFTEQDPSYGTVYHLRSAEDVLKLADREQGILWATHPRTKSTAGYPDAYKDKDFFLSDRFIGASWESLPVDLSEKGLCQLRCFGTEDDMNNWAPTPKYMLAESDSYQKYPDDETYPQLAVNYVKLDHVPTFNEGWATLVSALQKGQFFGATGEVLFHSWGVEGTGARRTYTASVEYTFPLDFAELVWSDGRKVDRQIIDLRDTLPFGAKDFRIPFDATGKKWVRFTVWDSAGDGAFIQPIKLN
jgi:hypothetical protein